MKKSIRTCSILFLILMICVIGATTVGVADIHFGQSLRIVLSKLLPSHSGWIDLSDIGLPFQKIVWSIRLPRVLMAMLVGVGLSISGAAYQGIFRNPMADPYVLGVSSGAAFGATLAIVFIGDHSYMGFSTVTICAFVGALSTIALVYVIGQVHKRNTIATLLLAGIAVSFFLSAIVSLLMIMHREAIERVYLWTMGSMAAANWTKVSAMLPVMVLGIIVLLAFSRDLDVMVSGEEEAKSLGINVDVVRKILLVSTSIMVASAVSVSGIIGFVGLIVPHTVRLFFGSSHKVLLPTSALCGGIFMVVTDTFARIAMPPVEIPVGAITAVVGAPYFIYLLLSRSGKR
ncbi:MAG: iron chelate uptake ABC transporter family permease subunit [Clostridia bacterium]|nr:iron chelate uptake ABC transporter family permease subunit [Clostridia bacterium]